MIPLEYILLLSAMLFTVGLVGVLTRKHAIIVLISVEIMLNAANLNFIAFWRYNPSPDLHMGTMFSLFAIAVAGAEVTVGLALVIAIYRHYQTLDTEALNRLKE